MGGQEMIEIIECHGCRKEIAPHADRTVYLGKSWHPQCCPVPASNEEDWQNTSLASPEIKPDPINPAYYLKGKIEVADFIADQKLDYFEGNVVKYICRWKDKGGVQDLEKIKWYLNKLIDQAVEGE
jgi:hypothetical protein